MKSFFRVTSDCQVLKTEAMTSVSSKSLQIVKCSRQKTMTWCSRDVTDHNFGNETFLQSIACSIKCTTMVITT